MRFGLFGSAQAKRGGPDANSAAGIRSLRRFAHEIMPAFSGTPVLDAVD